MKKLFICCLFLMLCGCSEVKDPIETTVSNVNDSKEWSARESIKGYASSVSASYMNYLMSGNTGDTVVNVDGDIIYLDVNYSGEDINCSNISIIDGKVKLFDCHIYSYVYDFDEKVIKK